MIAATQKAKSSEIVWNKTTRLLHWLVAACVAANFLNDGDDGVRIAHEIVGYSVTLLVIIRLSYGMFAKNSESFHSQFKNWPLSFSSVLTFIKSEIANKATSYKGHNPMACWTYFAIWANILSLGITGFMMGLDAFWGEEWLEDLHAALTNILLLLLAIHLAGMLKDAIKKKEKTWMKMIQGRV